MVPGIVEIKIRNGRLTVQDQGQYAKFSSFFFFFSIRFEIWMNGSSLEEGRWDWMGSVDIVRGSWRTQQRWSPLLIVNHIKVSNSKPSKGKMTKSLFLSFSLTLAVCLILSLGALQLVGLPKEA